MSVKMINKKKILQICENGTLTKFVNACLKEKGYKQSHINLTIKNLKKENKIQEIIVPPGRMLVTLHFRKKI
ncbi:TPA: hypothetical protein HA242_01365 [Candidatus Woesearchaeota archaeon]|nr:hypothetical protein [Candidatus Woesearchaeota archaeon]